MNKVAGVAGMIGTAYYALSLLVFMSREVEGSAFSRFIRMVVVAYYGVMTCVYLFHRFVVTYEEPSGEEIPAEAASE